MEGMENHFPPPRGFPANESPSREKLRREIPRDSWGVMQRIYGVRHSLLWPGQFAMLDMFKVATAWCLILSLGAVIAKLFW
jgi:hypothetical protein